MSTLPTAQQSSVQPHYETITGVVERLTFHSEESGYTVARLTRSRSTDLTTIVGSFANIQPGQTLQLTGFWKDHPQYGPQFNVTNYHETKPATLTGIEKYLGSGLIKGVGPVTARRIVAHFGLETLDIIENQIDRLIEVQGIAKKRIKLIKNAWETQKAIKEVMVFLQTHGVSTTYAVKIYKQYQDQRSPPSPRTRTSLPPTSTVSAFSQPTRLRETWAYQQAQSFDTVLESSTH